jgi:hypothetical protein
MTSRLQRWKPAQLLWIVGIANLASTVAVLVLAALSWHLPEDQRLPLQVKIPAFLAFVLSFAASLVAESALQRGIRSRVWPDSLLAAPRRLLSHPARTVITTLMMAGTLILFIILPLRSTPLGTLFMMLPLNLSRIRYSLDPPSADPLSTIPRLDLYPAKPLHSDQWGK